MKSVFSFIKFMWLQIIGITIAIIGITIYFSSCTKQEITKPIIENKIGLPTGITEKVTNADGTITIKFINLDDMNGNKYKNGIATFSVGTAFEMDGTIKIPDGGWSEINTLRNLSLCPNICAMKTSN